MEPIKASINFHWPQVTVGDRVIRNVSGVLRMELTVTEVDDEFIHCGQWKFSRRTGAEIDEVLGWTAYQTGSYLESIITNEN